MVRFGEGSDLAIQFAELEVVERVSSRQHLELFRHPDLGLVFAIDGVLQHVEAWQALYHEPLVHLPAAFVREVSSALILGGGSLFAAREVFRYPAVKRCVLVDHDPEVLQLMARHYDHARQVMADPRFEFVEGDAVEFIEGAGAHDLIVNDALDLLKGNRGPLYSRLLSLLCAGGACGDVIYRHYLDGEHLRTTRRALANLGRVALSMVTVPEYPGCLHALTIWGEHVTQAASVPRNEAQASWLTDRPPGLQFYDPRFLRFHLYVPPLLQRAWDEASQ